MYISNNSLKILTHSPVVVGLRVKCPICEKSRDFDVGWKKMRNLAL